VPPDPRDEVGADAGPAEQEPGLRPAQQLVAGRRDEVRALRLAIEGRTA